MKKEHQVLLADLLKLCRQRQIVFDDFEANAFGAALARALKGSARREKIVLLHDGDGAGLEWYFCEHAEVPTAGKVTLCDECGALYESGAQLVDGNEEPVIAADEPDREKVP